MTLRAQEKARTKRAAEPLGPKPLVIASSVKEHRRAEQAWQSEMASEIQNHRQAVAAQQQAAAKRATQRNAEIAQQRNTALVGAGTTIGGAVMQTPPARSATSTIMLVLFFFFALIVVYLLVTKPSQTSGFLGSLSSFLTHLTTTNPLFVRTSTSSSKGG
jgi:alkyl sulfatase BDS1-like metallo-beta-lactamase superfamily hydrolase